MKNVEEYKEDVKIKGVDLVKRIVIEVAIEKLNLSADQKKPFYEAESWVKKRLEEKASDYAKKVYGDNLIKIEVPHDNIYFKIDEDNEKMCVSGVYVILSYDENKRI